MDKLGARIQSLATRLSGAATPGQAPAPPDPAATEGAYRQALWRWFELATEGPDADREEVTRLYQELLRLMDEVGEPTATRLRRHWAREWWEETGVCPFCGERGPYHEPERGGDPSGERSPLEGE